MTEMSPGSAKFMFDCWRRRPCVFRNFLTEGDRTIFNQTRFRSWCDREVASRICVLAECEAPGAAKARILRYASDGLVLYDHYAAEGQPITLLLNGVDEIDAYVPTVQSRFRVPFEWRRGDTVATLSAANAGIGYHGGSEDGFIVQVAGERKWTVWSSDVLSHGYRRALAGDPIDAQTDPRSEASPLLVATLTPGDALYVPALFPHEGITRAESISLSFAWRGLSVYRIFAELHEARTGAVEPDVPRNLVEALCVLLEDPPPEADPEIFLCERLMKHFAALPDALQPSKRQVAAYVALLIEGGNHTSSTPGNENLNASA